jgi:hypothetical protein
MIDRSKQKGAGYCIVSEVARVRPIDIFDKKMGGGGEEQIFLFSVHKERLLACLAGEKGSRTKF